MQDVYCKEKHTSRAYDPAHFARGTLDRTVVSCVYRHRRLCRSASVYILDVCSFPSDQGSPVLPVGVETDTTSQDWASFPGHASHVWHSRFVELGVHALATKQCMRM
jgi:hypothetical protein